MTHSCMAIHLNYDQKTYKKQMLIDFRYVTQLKIGSSFLLLTIISYQV